MENFLSGKSFLQGKKVIAVKFKKQKIKPNHSNNNPVAKWKVLHGQQWHLLQEESVVPGKTPWPACEQEKYKYLKIPRIS